jgi:hypothetical protein
MAAARKKPKKPAVENDEEGVELVITYPNVRFSRDKIELLRDGSPVTTIDRNVVTALRVKRGSPSEHPVRETFWGLGLGLAGVLVLKEAFESGKLLSWVLGAGLLVVAALVARHLFGSVTLIELEGDWIGSTLNVEQAVPASEIARLNQRLMEDLGWPVKRWAGSGRLT